MKKMHALRVLVGSVLLALSAEAPAAIISGTYSFCTNPGGTIDPFCASFSLTFDNSADVGETTTGITLLTQPVGFTLGSALGFRYLAAFDALQVGGVETGVGGVNFGTNDFIINISDATSGSPLFDFFTYATSGGSGGDGVEGTVTFTPGGIGVPEPGILALLGLGFAGLGFARRRNAR